MNEEEFTHLVARARDTNASRDAAEEEVGFAHPGQGDWFMDLRTAMTALYAGMRCEDWDNVAEGYVMLEGVIDLVGAHIRGEGAA